MLPVEVGLFCRVEVKVVFTRVLVPFPGTTYSQGQKAYSKKLNDFKSKQETHPENATPSC